MNHATAANIVRTRVEDAFRVPNDIVVAFDNVEFSPDASTQKYAVASIRFGDSVRVEMGSAGMFRTAGILYLQLLTRVGQGDGDALELADAARKAFRAITVGGLRFRSPSISTQGQVDGWWRVTVACPFDFDDQVQE